MFGGKGSLWYLFKATPAYKTSRKIFDQMDEICQSSGIDADEMPNGEGRFGYEPTNPIPTRTIFGSSAYLLRLRDLRGRKMMDYARVGSVSPKNIDYPVLVYSVRTADTEFQLFFSPYQKRNSTKSPEGLKLIEPPIQPPPFKTKKERQSRGLLSWGVACLTRVIIRCIAFFASRR